MIEFDDLITLSNRWFYIAFISPIVFGLVDLLMYNKIRSSRTNPRRSIKYFVFLFLFYLLDLSIFIISVKKCPHAFISYFFSIYIPLPTLFFVIISSLSASVKVIKKFSWKIEAVCDYLPYFFLLSGIKISFALAYGSVCGVIWILIDVIMSLVKMFSLTETFELYYEKKYN